MITDKILLYIAAVVAGLAMIACTTLGVKLYFSEHALAEAKFAVIRLTADLEEQNRAVGRMANASVAAHDRASQALAAAEVAAGEQKASIDALQARILTSKATTCTAALAEIRGDLK